MARWEKVQNDGRIGIVPDIKVGMLTPGELAAITEVARRFGERIHLTAGQRLIILGVPPERVEEAKNALQAAGFGVGTSGAVVRNVRACPGKEYCKNGLQPTLDLGRQLHERFTGWELQRPVKIGISGCPNSCSEARTRDIGIYGVPSGYKVFIGGKGGMKPMDGRPLKIVKADRAPELVDVVQKVLDFYTANAGKRERIGDLVARIGFEPFQEAVKGRVVMVPAIAAEAKAVGEA
ncbi:MAG: NAD(P)/FAD-dependent oxidoreductase [Euryarchaeota archaeon]|nr:NAD(P)/FAD-dependent oxidoreductase [Euryarchaeota archaeon]